MAGIYIHIPFCHSKCYYCDFYSRPCKNGAETLAGQYIKALACEWQMRRNEISQPITTLYIGGGTPSAIPPELYAYILQFLPLENVTEFTVEANPEDVTPRWAATIKSLGVNRISMGVQSMIHTELESVGRRHTPADAVNAYLTLRSAGFDNISLDLIYGLPKQTPESWEYSLNKLLSLRPEHLSAYSLTYEEGTRLNAMRLAGKIAPTTDDTVVAMYQKLCKLTEDAGYRHYEISNFALPDMYARHNSSYWDFSPYIGLGVAAHSFDGKNMRRSNPADIQLYIKAMESGQSFALTEQESVYDIYNDYVITGLRTHSGISNEKMQLRFGPEMVQRLVNDMQKHIAAGNIEKSHGRWRIAPDSWLISDAILRDIII